MKKIVVPANMKKRSSPRLGEYCLIVNAKAKKIGFKMRLKMRNSEPSLFGH